LRASWVSNWSKVVTVLLWRQVWMRTTAGPQRVDVIYRRVDDEVS
jgi:uncharacterized circularly permuted ATP-grasp superfamily protein